MALTDDLKDYIARNCTNTTIIKEKHNVAIVAETHALLKTNISEIRTKATDAENKAIVEGSIAHYGKYSVDDGGKALTFHVEVSTFPNWDGKPQKRMLTVKGDTLTYVVATPSTGGAPSEVTWKRVKK